MSEERPSKASIKAIDKALKLIIYLILVSMGQFPRLSLHETSLIGTIRESNQA